MIKFASLRLIASSKEKQSNEQCLPNPPPLSKASKSVVHACTSIASAHLTPVLAIVENSQPFNILSCPDRSSKYVIGSTLLIFFRLNSLKEGGFWNSSRLIESKALWLQPLTMKSNNTVFR